MSQSGILQNMAAEPVNLINRGLRSMLVVGQTFVEIIDVSKWQPASTIDYVALKAGGVQCVILKATEGTTISDPEFTAHWQKAHAAGLLIHVYHFFRSNLSGTAQANHFWNTIQPLVAALGYIPPLWVDVETTDNVLNLTRLLNLNSILTTLDTLAGVGRAGIYTSPGFANVHLTPVPSWINNYWHWLAHWTSAALPTQPTGWSTTQRKLWQYGVWNNYAWCQPVPGCVPDIDRDKFFGDLPELVEFTGSPIPPIEEEYVTYEEFEALAALVENLTAITPTHIISGAGSNGEKFRATPGGNERWMVPNGREVRWVTENATSVLCEMVYRGRVELGWVDKENLTPF